MSSAPTDQTPLDLLLVGCGLRAIGLLTSTPSLFDYDLGVVDERNQPGAGAFSGYDIESNSNGSDFFGWINPAGPFGPLLKEEPIERLRSTRTGFHLGLLADALACAGGEVVGRLAPGRLFSREKVVELWLPAGSGSGLVGATTESGRLLWARTAILATGIRERIEPELLACAHELVPSGALLGLEARSRCAELANGGGPVCIVGASHSAFSVLARILDQSSPTPRAPITLLSRSPIRIFYESWDDYLHTGHQEGEAKPRPTMDVCPETGNVHRYSGLRNTSKKLFLAAVAGRVSGVRLIFERDPGQRRPYLEQAAVVIQATGHGSNMPRITYNDRAVRCAGPDGVVEIDDEGHLCTEAGVAESVFAMGLDPYPYDDNSINPTNQYARRGRHLLARLSRCHGSPSAAAAGAGST